MYKIAKILAIILGVAGLVLWVLIVQQGAESGMVDVMINLAVYMTLIVAAIALLMSIWQLITHPDKLKKSLISLAAFALVLLISYFVLSSGSDIDLEAMSRRGIEVDEATSKLVGGGLIAFYILAGVAVLAMLLSGAKKIISK
ncbi:hypothetical protein [Robertkochia aurantiaca]|uniref:hypothetical protein n=1 Tax=Robertkochia aurantiaca TaxID=2873700 RepID=UPI001CC90F10|nr:hypothetical protein [Robertkochia sp. 3YJGBD-33]